MKEKKIFDRLKSDYELVESMGHDVVGVFLQGSQNYELDYEGSDIDTKAIVIPKFDDFVLNKKAVSTTHILPSDEHVDLKDIRLMFQTFKKQNINFVEILFTKYKILNPRYEELFSIVLENNEKIARYNNYATLNCMVGMAFEKRKALCHPYPATKDKIEKYGFDGKQISHIARLNEFMGRYLDGEKYSNCLISKQREYLIDVKTNRILSLEDAKRLADLHTSQMKQIKDEYMKENEIQIDKEAEELLNDVLIRIIKKSFIEQIK